MKLPHVVPVMTLPQATLFPHALLPLYIFEPRYRRMLLDVLEGERMFCIAMQTPGRKREVPSPIAGLGLIRLSVDHADGTSHLILQGIARVQLAEAVRYRPYRLQRIRMLESAPCNTVVVDALWAKLRELLDDRLKLGLPFRVPFAPKNKMPESQGEFSARDVLEYLDRLTDPEQVADTVSGVVLERPAQRQKILEAVNVEERFKHLIHFLMAEIRQHGKDTI